MPSDDDKSEVTTLAPDDAFAVLGNETRMEILQTLGEADGPLAFSELFDRVPYEDPANFTYHLDKLVGHFIRKTGTGYVLEQAGKRVVKAVLSGTVTEAPVVDLTRPEPWSCPYCGAPSEIGYHRDRVWIACPECAGTYGKSIAPSTLIGPAEYGYIGYVRLPPAGLQGRTSMEILEAGATWGHLDFLAMASGVCPRCGARVDRSVSVCERHDVDSDRGLCDQCDCRHAVQLHTRCSNCIHEGATPFVLGRLIATTEFLAFLATHGINPVSPSPWGGFHAALLNYDEEVVSVAPFEARFTVTVDDDAVTLTVDDDLTVVEATKHDASETI